MSTETEKKPLIILTGPTAVGKSELSIRLAKSVNGAVVSADSMQVYRGMDIGSAKIRRDQMEGVPHYMVDILDPEEEFHVVRFQEMAKEAMDEIYDLGQIPLLVGGTGFYIQAVLYDIDFTEQEEDSALREEYERIAKEKGADYLHEKLREVDPDSADAIHANNIKRTIRALEFYEKSGSAISEHNMRERQKDSPYNFCYFVLNDERERIYQKINERVDHMLKEGLIDEVQALKDRGCTADMVSMQGLGYKEILRVLDGEMSLDNAVYTIKRDTRHFAKRQLSWFRRERDVVWIDKPDFDYEDDRILAYMLDLLREKQII
ncbi:MAG: tRNA (adenosine(37)-N6)-dimethylallyltransferase MiaA [Lachnospiraceae bacterium]|nr:tRNA (adenosine(37)-N6)-dimethylallyltransferase MiaA [Lachnospiraceae bacterium]